jgi:hypothetical protein
MWSKERVIVNTVTLAILIIWSVVVYAAYLFIANFW